MIMYLMCFFLTIAFTYVAEKNFENKKKKKGIILSILAILQPAILAGLRSSSVGIDVEIYVNKTFLLALNSPDFSTFAQLANVETGYCMLNYIVSRITSDVHWLYFISEAIVVFFVYYTLYKERKNTKMWLGMAVFLFVFYSETLNLARQSLAIAIILYSTSTMKNKKYITTACLFIISLLFHNSTILAFPIYIIILFNRLKINNKAKFIIYLSTFSVFVFLLFRYEEIIKFLTFDLKILSSKYTDYLNSDYFVNEKIDISFFKIFFRFIWMIMTLILFSIHKTQKKDNEIYMFFLLIDTSIVLLSSKITNIFRVGYYYGIIAMVLLIPNLINIFKKDKKNQNYGKIIVIAILFGYWFYSAILHGGSGVYPYTSDIISIFNYIP